MKCNSDFGGDGDNVKDGEIMVKAGGTDKEGSGNASLCVGKRLGRFKKKPAMFSKNIAGFYVSSGGA